MPELPEVECVRQNISPHILNKEISVQKIADVKLFKTKKELLEKTLNGNEFVSIDRVGKYLFFRLKNGPYSLCIHLGMSGQLYAQNKPIKENHLHFILELEDSHLWYRDPRRFGKIFLFEIANPKEHPLLKKLGVDTLEIKQDVFVKSIQKKRKPIKILLMDQSILAGVGNIYADEVLFRVGIHPKTKANIIPKGKLQELHIKLIQLLQASIIAKGSSVTYAVGGENQKGSFQEQLFVYRKEGQKCKICDSKIERIIVAQRGTCFCPKCQPEIKNELPCSSRDNENSKSTQSPNRNPLSTQSL